MNWKNRLATAHQYLLPQKILTGLVYRLTRLQHPHALVTAMIRLFIRVFDVDMSEATQPEPSAYADFNSFFTRPLRDGVRPVCAGPGALASPVDGTVSQAGAIAGDHILQAKGHHYSAHSLLGNDPRRTRIFENGGFATLYLSPRDYHRIHMPCSGTLREMVHVPGRLFSVSAQTTRGVPDLFARNERLVCLFESNAGPWALVLVGAINVASMSTAWAGVVTPPYGGNIRTTGYPAAGETGAVSLDKGMEMGRFNMGSTVILLFPENTVSWLDSVVSGATVRVGAQLGHIRAD